ncbi:MAG: FAD:protein FMN transferase [Clostridia bacterium]|nr:FAD:protein FMN transferase [Clostridia bacterium]
MIKKSVSALLLVAILLIQPLILVSCGKPRRFKAYDLNSFDTATTVIGYARTRGEFNEVSDRIFERLRHYHRLFDIYHKYDGIENLCTVNSLEGGEHRTVTVHRDIIDMLLYAKETYELTGGVLNVAMGSVLSIWHEYRTAGLDDPMNAALPPMSALLSAAEHVSLDSLVIDEAASTVTLTDPHLTLDVGAIAKGWAVEQIARELEADKISGYVLNVGGNIRIIGEQAGGEPWSVGIENPFGDPSEPYLKYLSLKTSAVVTSGSYQRFYVVGGKSYHHIIDPATLMPSERYTSLSIVCRDSGLGDALSTALFCMSIEDGRALVATLEGVEVMWVTPDGKITTTDGFSALEMPNAHRG